MTILMIKLPFVVKFYEFVTCYSFNIVNYASHFFTGLFATRKKSGSSMSLFCSTYFAFLLIINWFSSNTSFLNRIRDPPFLYKHVFDLSICERQQQSLFFYHGVSIIDQKPLLRKDLSWSLYKPLLIIFFNFDWKSCFSPRLFSPRLLPH